MKEAAGCAGLNEILCKLFILQCVTLTEKCFTWVKSDYKNKVKMELHPFCQKYGKKLFQENDLHFLLLHRAPLVLDSLKSAPYKTECGSWLSYLKFSGNITLPLHMTNKTWLNTDLSQGICSLKLSGVSNLDNNEVTDVLSTVGLSSPVWLG